MAHLAPRAFTATLLLALSGAGATLAMAAPAGDVPRKPADLVERDRLARELAELGTHPATGNAARRADAGRMTTAAWTPDTTPPMLTGLKLTSTIAVDKPGAGVEWRASYSATDDRAGVTSGYAVATGPAGQQVTVRLGNGVAATSVTNGRGIVFTHPWLVPGTYEVNYAIVYDGAQNYRYVYPADLDAIGAQRTFQVVNALGGDAVPPTVVKATVRQPTMSLSAHAPGTEQGAQFVVDMHVQDTGNGQVSGFRTGFVHFCQGIGGRCITLVMNECNAEGITAQTTPAWQRPGDLDLPTGTYTLSTVELYDHANNKATLKSVAYGGTTDFSTIFNTTSITFTK